MIVNEEFQENYGAWYARANKERKDTTSKERRNYMARRQTNALKLAMILSVSESDSMVVTWDHLKAADKLLMEVYGSFKKIVDYTGKNAQQHGLNLDIKNIFDQANGTGVKEAVLRTRLRRSGHSVGLINNTIDYMIKSKELVTMPKVPSEAGPRYTLWSNPDNDI
jgi:hypothetical protein